MSGMSKYTRTTQSFQPSESDCICFVSFMGVIKDGEEKNVREPAKSGWAIELNYDLQCNWLLNYLALIGKNEG